MNTPLPKHVSEHLARIGRDNGFQEFVGYLRAELEDAKAALVNAEPSGFQRLQGRAQALTDILVLVDPKPTTRMTVRTLP